MMNNYAHIFDLLTRLRQVIDVAYLSNIIFAVCLFPCLLHEGGTKESKLPIFVVDLLNQK